MSSKKLDSNGIFTWETETGRIIRFKDYFDRRVSIGDTATIIDFVENRRVVRSGKIKSIYRVKAGERCVGHVVSGVYAMIDGIGERKIEGIDCIE